MFYLPPVLCVFAKANFCTGLHFFGFTVLIDTVVDSVFDSVVDSFSNSGVVS